MNMSKNVKIRIGIFALGVILALTLLISGICALRRPVLLLLGFDLTDYEGEEVITSLPTDSEAAKKVCDIIGMLLYSPDPAIAEFEGADEAAKLYTDSVLSYLMGLNYSKYMCNLDLLSRASDSYSNYNFRTLIPAADFKAEIYRAFGGERVVTANSAMAFKYHEKIDSFSCVGSPYTLSAKVRVTSFGATEHAYKMTFIIETENSVSAEYVATAIERDDTTMYIKCIKNLAGK